MANEHRAADLPGSTQESWGVIAARVDRALDKQNVLLQRYATGARACVAEEPQYQEWQMQEWQMQEWWAHMASWQAHPYETWETNTGAGGLVNPWIEESPMNPWIEESPMRQSLASRVSEGARSLQPAIAPTTDVVDIAFWRAHRWQLDGATWEVVNLDGRTCCSVVVMWNLKKSAQAEDVKEELMEMDLAPRLVGMHSTCSGTCLVITDEEWQANAISIILDNSDDILSEVLRAPDGPVRAIRGAKDLLQTIASMPAVLQEDFIEASKKSLPAFQSTLKSAQAGMWSV